MLATSQTRNIYTIYSIILTLLETYWNTLNHGADRIFGQVWLSLQLPKLAPKDSKNWTPWYSPSCFPIVWKTRQAKTYTTKKIETLFSIFNIHIDISYYIILYIYISMQIQHNPTTCSKNRRWTDTFGQSMDRPVSSGSPAIATLATRRAVRSKNCTKCAWAASCSSLNPLVNCYITMETTWNHQF
jgi:hypothetical protein